MGVTLWFGLSIALAILYSSFIVMEPIEVTKDRETKTFKLGIIPGLVLIVLAVIFAVFVYLGWLNKLREFFLGKIFSIFMLVFGCFFGLISLIGYFADLVRLRGVIGMRIIMFGSLLSSIALTVSFYRWPNVINNPALLFMALGFGTLFGELAHRRLILLIFSFAFMFDIYGVWFSDTIIRVVKNYPFKIPIGFISGDRFFGVGDVVFSVVAITFITEFASLKAGVITGASFLVLIIVLEILRMFSLVKGVFPGMFIISPVTIFMAYAWPWLHRGS